MTSVSIYVITTPIVLNVRQTQCFFKIYISEIKPESLEIKTEPELAQVSADQFHGECSLATTRMFFRKHSGLAVNREMMAEIEKIAGYERADSINTRIAMLLPPRHLGF